ncbi:MAG: hypothetical protein ACFB10_02790 [Salibacteraceae bacterium]
MKIELTSSKGDVNRATVIYVLIPCFMDDSHDIGKTVEMTVTNLPEDRDLGCYRNVYNTINSNGMPFYYCEEMVIK